MFDTILKNDQDIPIDYAPKAPNHDIYIYLRCTEILAIRIWHGLSEDIQGIHRSQTLRVPFDEKMVARKAIGQAQISHSTYVYFNLLLTLLKCVLFCLPRKVSLCMTLR